MLSYMVVFPRGGEQYTEFYILGNNGKAETYPSIFTMKNNDIISVQYGDKGITTYGEPGKVTVGIINHEQLNSVYSVAITIDGQESEIYYAGQHLTRIENIELSQGGKWEQEIGFTPQHSGDNQKIEFLLYKNNKADPDETLHLWINVKK